MNTTTTTMTCLCGTEHTFAPGEGAADCESCGMGLMLTETVDGDPAEMSDTPHGLCDDEPGDIDSDAGFDPYTGGAEDDGYDRGCFDDFGCDDGF